MEVEKQREAAGIEPDPEIDAFIKVKLFLYAVLVVGYLAWLLNITAMVLTFLFLWQAATDERGRNYVTDYVLEVSFSGNIFLNSIIFGWWPMYINLALFFWLCPKDMNRILKNKKEWYNMSPKRPIKMVGSAIESEKKQRIVQSAGNLFLTLSRTIGTSHQG